MPTQNYDAGFEPHVARSPDVSVWLQPHRIGYNKTNMSGFSYLSADSGLVSSAAVAHRARTASRRSAGAGRSGALWSGDDCMSWNATCLRAAASSPFAFI